MTGSHPFVRALLAFVSAGHASLGLLALLSGNGGTRIGARIYGARFEPTAQFQYGLRPLGAFMLGLAYLQYLAFRDPWRYRGAIDATLLVFALRTYQRIAFRRQIATLFGIAPDRHRRTTLSLQALGALLLVARLRLRPPASQDGVRLATATQGESVIP